MIAVVAAGLLAGTPAGSLGQVPVQAEPPAADHTANSPQSDRLEAGDRLGVIVYGEDRISGQQTVDPEGGITLPLVGRIAAAGLTIDELTEALRAALADGYLRHPSVAVQMLSYRPIYVLGEVNKPGQYGFTKGLTVVDAIAMAAGYTYRARKSAVFITHHGEAREQRLPLTPSLAVVPGDTIRVGERYF